MSYGLILDEIGGVLEAIRKDRGPPRRRGRDNAFSRFKEAERVVIDRRLTNGDVEPLVAYAVENFDSVDGDETIIHLSDGLAAQRRARELKRLWKGVIANRRQLSGKLRPEGDPTITAFQQKARIAFARAGAEFAAKLRQLDEGLAADEVEDGVRRFLAGEQRQRRLVRDDRDMTSAVFWDIIDRSLAIATDTTEQVELIIEQLERLPASAITAFQGMVDEYLAEANRHDLWAVAYIVRGDCGDDEFEYFRAWLITQGREAFEHVTAHPESIAQHLGDSDPQAERFLYAAAVAFQNSTSKPMPAATRDSRRTTGEAWIEADLPTLYPTLWSQFRS